MLNSHIENILVNQSQFIERFGTYEQTDYEIRTLEDLCEPIKDGTHQTPTYTNDKENGYPFYSSKDVTSRYMDWDHPMYIPAELHEQLYKRIAPRKGDILLAKNGTTGIAAIVDRDEVFDIYVSLALLRPHPGNDVKYLWAAINMPETKKQFDASLKGIGVPNLHLGEIKKARIVVPPLEMQHEFSTLLEQSDKSKFVGSNRNLSRCLGARLHLKRSGRLRQLMKLHQVSLVKCLIQRIRLMSISIIISQIEIYNGSNLILLT